MGVPIGILLLNNLELEIYCMLYAVHKLYFLLPLLSHHFGSLVGDRIVLFSPSCRPAIFRKIHRSIPADSERIQNGGSECRSGVLFTFPLDSNTRKVAQVDASYELMTLLHNRMFMWMWCVEIYVELCTTKRACRPQVLKGRWKRNYSGYPHVFKSSNPMELTELCTTKPEVVNLLWRPPNWKYQYLSL